MKGTDKGKVSKRRKVPRLQIIDGKPLFDGEVLIPPEWIRGYSITAKSKTAYMSEMTIKLSVNLSAGETL